MSFAQAHALLIGVGSYRYAPHLNVPITTRDAQALHTVLVDPDRCAYPPGQVTLLHDDKTKTGDLLAALDALAAVDPNDTVLIFYSGHGDRGTDGAYYLTAHDTQLQGNRIKTGTGVSEADLLTRLRAIPAKRLLLIFNACHAGAVSPNLGVDDQAEDETVDEKLADFGSQTLSVDTADAILSTGEGRIIITACRPEQKSWISDPSGPSTIFARSLVEGLRGEGLVAPRGGFISAYDLYEQTYFGVKAASEAMGQLQEPELTILRGVGPFPVALYHGAVDLGTFPAQQALPSDTATRTVDPALSRRKLERRSQINVTGDRNVVAGRDITDSHIITGDDNVISRDRIDTQGGAYVGGNVRVSDGDFVGRDKIEDHSRHTVFDQRGQQVSGNQYNIAGDYNAAAAEDRVAGVAELKKLIDEINHAQSTGHLDSDTATEAEYQVKRAVNQAEKPDADKRTILDHLSTANEVMTTAAAATGLVTAVTQAIQMVQRLF